MNSFERQVETLVRLGYPEMLGCTRADFERRLAPLAQYAIDAGTEYDVDDGKIGSVLVIHTKQAPVERTLPLVAREGKPAVERLFPRTPGYFEPLDSLRPLIGDAYLLLDVDRGNDTLNMVPLQAADHLARSGRSPITVQEGVALLTHFPDLLQPNRCFMMLGSRGGDKRVPALWLSDRQPKLGWCWEGNPHTWLGFASAGGRSPAIALHDG